MWATAEMAPSGGGGNVTATAPIGMFEISGIGHGAGLCNDVDGKTVQEALRYALAISTGEIADAGTGEETFKGLDGLTDRVKVTVDSSGNRSAVVLDPP